jgi:hypothetical protein
VNNADDFLHLALGIALLAGWFVSKSADEPARDRPMATTPAP